MEKSARSLLYATVALGVALIVTPVLLAQPKGPPPEVIKGAFRQILGSVDKNADGKLSLEECMTVSSNKSKIEKDCRYWDENGDGWITEDEYVRQAQKAMK